MASSSRGRCEDCYAGLQGSPECCLRNQKKPGRRLCLAKIECALKDEKTREEFKLFFEDRENIRNLVLVEIYRRLYDFELSQSPIKKFHGVLQGINTLINGNEDFQEDYFEQRLEEEFLRIIYTTHPCDAELDKLRKDMGDYIIDELQDGFSNFVSYIVKKYKW